MALRPGLVDMARMPRLVVPGLPHHVTQRGARRMKTFYNTGDYLSYLDLIVEFKTIAGVDIWAYCLMPNHVHLVVVPEEKDSLAILFRHVHRLYTREINVRQGCTGHLWQERYHSFVMDESHLLATSGSFILVILCDTNHSLHHQSSTRRDRVSRYTQRHA